MHPLKKKAFKWAVRGDQTTNHCVDALNLRSSCLSTMVLTQVRITTGHNIGT